MISVHIWNKIYHLTAGILMIPELNWGRINQLESVQRRLTKRLPGFHSLLYNDRCARLGIASVGTSTTSRWFNFML